MSMVKNGLKGGAFRFRNSIAGNHPKTLLTLYQRRSFDIARVGAPSPLANSSGKQAGS
jgi:hypothetical protein